MNAAFARHLASALSLGLFAACGGSAMTPGSGPLGPRSSAAVRISVSVAPRVDFSRLAEAVRSASGAAPETLRLSSLPPRPGGLGYAIVAGSALAPAPVGQADHPSPASLRRAAADRAPLLFLVVPD